MLDNITVLEVADVWSGPMAGLLLLDMGAKVIKVEPPEWKRPLETRLAQRDDPLFLALNRGKKSLVLDLSLPAGKEIFAGLVKKSDVVLSNYPPGVARKLGLDYDTLGPISPRIICCNISGYGMKGKDLERPAYDLAIQAISGVMSVTGEEGRVPVRAGIPLADQEAAMVAALGILAAYIGLQKCMRGRQVDISMFDTMLLNFAHNAVDFYSTGNVPVPHGSGPTTRKRADHRAYRTSDGYIVLANGRGDDKWRDLCKALGKPELGTDVRFDIYDKRIEGTARTYLESIFEPLLVRRATNDWLKLFYSSDIPCAPVNRLDEVLQSAECQGRNMIISYPHPLGGFIKGVGNPVKADVEENLDPPPRLGEHTKQVLMEILQYSDSKIDLLRKDKVIFAES